MLLKKQNGFSPRLTDKIVQTGYQILKGPKGFHKKYKHWGANIDEYIKIENKIKVFL